MPIQGSGSISLSELATEFGGQAPHSLTEYLKDAGLVDSTRAITGSESYTSLVTGDQVGTTGIYVNGGTDSKTCTNASFSAQTSSSRSGDDQYTISVSQNSGDSIDDMATTITISSGTYVNISLRSYHRYYTFTSNSIAYNGYLAFWGDGATGGRDLGFDFRTQSSGDVFTTGYEVVHEFTAGQSSDFSVSGSNARDLSAISRNNYTANKSGSGWHARPAKNNTNVFKDTTIKGYATQNTTIILAAFHDFGSSQNGSGMAGNGPATGNDPTDGTTPYTSVTQNSSLTMNQFKAYNTNSYALSCNSTNIPANTASENAVVFADNLLTTNTTASVTGNQPINSGVPSSGALSLTDFYSSEEQ